MTVTILLLILLLLLFLGMVVLAIGSWRSKHLLARWLGGIVTSLLALVLMLVTALGVVGLVKFETRHDVALPQMQTTGSVEQVARGHDIANYFCASCHSTTNELPLTGGVDIGGDFPIPLGAYVSPNLTPAGPLTKWTDAEIFRGSAHRHR